MLHGRPALEQVEQAFLHEPIVRALVVGLDAALVREPELSAAPVRLELSGELVGRSRSRAA
jgi:hypothetical protein